MKTHAWMLCCLGLLAPLPFATAEEQPQGFVKITVGVEGEGLEKIPVLGPLFQHYFAGQNQACCEEVQVKLPPPPANYPVCQPSERGVPMLSKLPYVGRLFKNVGPVPADEICQTEEMEVVGPAPKTVRWVAPDGLERIGVDFDCEVTEQCAQCQAKRCPLDKATRATAVCPQPIEWKPVAVPPPANCPAIAVCPPPHAGYCEVLPAPFTVVQQPQLVASRDELIEALMEARVEAAIAQTALKVREESDAKQLELLKELVTSQVENAKLTAKLELAEEKEKLLAQLIETHVELATLKAQVAKDSQVARRKRVPNGVESPRTGGALEALR